MESNILWHTIGERSEGEHMSMDASALAFSGFVLGILYPEIKNSFANKEYGRGATLGGLSLTPLIIPAIAHIL